MDIYGDEQGSASKGRLALVLRDGSVHVYSTSFVASSASSGDVAGVEGAFDEGRGSRRRDGRPATYTGLDMSVGPLASFCAAAMDGASSHLRYVRARWMTPLVLVLLTRSPFLDEDFLHGNCVGAAAASSAAAVVAQVWTVAEVAERAAGDRKAEAISEERHVQWAFPPTTEIALVSELTVPCDEGLQELAHGTFCLLQPDPVRRNVDNDGDNHPDLQRKCRPAFSECTRSMWIFHHQETDSLAINSQLVKLASSFSAVTGVAPLEVRPFCLIWDWKRNVPGFTLVSSKPYRIYRQLETDTDMCSMPSLFSRFHLGEDEDLGVCGVHLYEQALFERGRCTLKDTFCVSTLSPSNGSSAKESLRVVEPSALLLHRDAVTFPSLGRVRKGMHSAAPTCLCRFV